MQTLAELKAQNAAEEEAARKAAEEAEARAAAEVEEAGADPDPEGEPQPDPEDPETPEGEEPGGGEGDPEPWMQGDEGSPDADKKFGDGDVAAAKRKLRAKLERQHQSETEQLRKEIEELKKSRSEPQPDISSSLPPHPKWDDFAESDNQDADYQKALVDWQFRSREIKADAERKAQELKRQREEALSRVSNAVDQHYERAVTLAEKSGISPEAYRAADLKVRQAIDEVFNGSGDQVADALIANLGDGSEKVLYNLGVNSARREELINRLKTDQSGISAAAYLGQLNAELKLPSKRTTSAPKPSPQISGDKKGSSDAKRLREKYRKASGQAAYELRKEARRQGIDTREW